MSYEAWDAYIDRYGNEPTDAKQLASYSKNTAAIATLNYKQSNEQFKRCKGKGKIGGDGATAAAASDTAAASADNNNNSNSNSGGNALFNSLQQGLDVTHGLKKVTSDMKTKNRSDRSGLVKAPVKKKAKAKTEATKEPVIRPQGPILNVEYFTEGTQTMDGENHKITTRTEIRLYKCSDFGLVLPVKCKSVQLLDCKKVQCQVSGVVSQIEMINCQSCTVYVDVNAPTVNVDQCSAPKLVIMPAAMVNPPEIITANTSDMNVEIPGATEEDDWITYCVPYQYKTTIDAQNRTFTTEAVAHM
jgi:adenylyl cyclase-associated protein